MPHPHPHLSPSPRPPYIHIHTQCNFHYSVLLAKYEIRSQMRHQNGLPLILHCPVMVLKVVFPYWTPLNSPGGMGTSVAAYASSASWG